LQSENCFLTFKNVFKNPISEFDCNQTHFLNFQTPFKMTNTFQRISEINSSKSSWSLKAKVIRLWTVSDFNRNTLPFSVEMVLIDSEVFHKFYSKFCAFFVKPIDITLIITFSYYHNIETMCIISMWLFSKFELLLFSFMSFDQN
jgi:hypothetical protein